MPEVLELVPDFVDGKGAAGNDGAVVGTLADAELPFCGGAKL